VGVDLFLESWVEAGEAGRALEALAGDALTLQMISSRGTMVYPETGLKPDSVGLLRARFVAREEGAAVSDAELAALLGRVGEQFAWTHVEKLHLFGGEPSYTKAQGQ
jgi:isocitrate dehydrogenase